MKTLESQEEEKCTFTDGKNTRERTKKETLPVALKKKPNLQSTLTGIQH